MFAIVPAGFIREIFSLAAYRLVIIQTKKEAENAKTYINTKFFHFLLTLRKNTQDCLGKVFTYIPMQDFSKPWTDAELYDKYKLSQDEIDFIESMIRPME